MTYKCLLCGRDKFTHKSPHKCNGGFRKRKLKWETYDYEGYSFKEGLSGTCNGITICTSYTDYPIFLLLAKLRIWLRFKLLKQ